MSHLIIIEAISVQILHIYAANLRLGILNVASNTHHSYIYLNIVRYLKNMIKIDNFPNALFAALI